MRSKTPILNVDDDFYRELKRHELAIRFGVVNMLPSNWTTEEFTDAVKRRNEILYGISKE